MKTGIKWLTITIVLILAVGLTAGCARKTVYQGDFAEYDLLRQVVGVVEKEYGGVYDVDAMDLALSEAVLTNLDPYSYLSSNAYTQASSATVGLLTHRTVYNEYFVTNVYEGLPADTTFEDGFHLQRGDEIYAVNGNRLRGLGSSYFSAFVAGEAGTELTLTVYREGQKVGDYTYVKQAKTAPNVSYVKDVFGVGSGIAYIKLNTFALSQTEDGNVHSPATEFAEAMQSLQADGQKGLVLDLRGNGGGSVSVLGEIAAFFVPHGADEQVPVLQLEYTKTKEVYTQKTGKHAYVDIPLTILTDGGTASAAEALTGACRAYNPHVKVIGADTYGKGVFQRTGIKVTDHTKESELTFDDNYYIVLVAGYYYIVDPHAEGGRYNIHGNPIVPDVKATTQTIGALQDDRELIESRQYFDEFFDQE